MCIVARAHKVGTCYNVASVVLYTRVLSLVPSFAPLGPSYMHTRMHASHNLTCIAALHLQVKHVSSQLGPINSFVRSYRTPVDVIGHLHRPAPLRASTIAMVNALANADREHTGLSFSPPDLHQWKVRHKHTAANFTKGVGARLAMTKLLGLGHDGIRSGGTARAGSADSAAESVWAAGTDDALVNGLVCAVLLPDYVCLGDVVTFELWSGAGQQSDGNSSLHGGSSGSNDTNGWMAELMARCSQWWGQSQGVPWADVIARTNRSFCPHNLGLGTEYDDWLNVVHGHDYKGK